MTTEHLNPVRVALKEFMKADAELMETATGVYHRRPPDDAELPYVLFDKGAGIPLWSFSGPPMDKDVWRVMGCGNRAQAETIDHRLKEILNGATLPIEGKVHQDIRSIGDIDFDEVKKGERIDYVGAEYKLDSESE